MKEFYRLHTRNNMDESEFRIATKYLGDLKQELQDEIVDAIWDMGIMVTTAKKLEEQKQRVVSRVQQR